MYTDGKVQLESVRSELTDVANSRDVHITHAGPKVNTPLAISPR